MNLSDRLIRARRDVDMIDVELLETLTAACRELDYHEAVCDPSDWDGTSLELYGVTPVGAEFSDEQLAAVWSMGFTVLRLYYEAPDGSAPHDGITNRAAGDWWRVKGLPAGKCPCSERRAGSGT